MNKLLIQLDVKTDEGTFAVLRWCGEVPFKPANGDVFLFHPLHQITLSQVCWCVNSRWWYAKDIDEIHKTFAEGHVAHLIRLGWALDEQALRQRHEDEADVDEDQDQDEPAQAVMSEGMSSEPAVTAMEALFAFTKTVTDGELSISDLRTVMSIAIESGHDNMAICLGMASEALRLARKQ